VGGVHVGYSDPLSASCTDKYDQGGGRKLVTLNGGIRGRAWKKEKLIPKGGGEKNTRGLM